MIKFLLLPVFLLTLSMARLCQSVQNKRSLKHIWQFIVENYSTVASIKAHDFNFVQLGISPVEFLFVEINGYAIRPSHRCVHQSNTITTIQSVQNIYLPEKQNLGFHCINLRREVTSGVLASRKITLTENVP